MPRVRLLVVVCVLGALVLAAWVSRPVMPVRPSPQPIAVSVARVTREDIPITLTGLGIVQALNQVTIHARVDGELKRVAFAEGQMVHAGDVIAEIDQRPLQAQRDQAQAAVIRDEAQLENARLDLQRLSGLVKRQYTSEQSVDTGKATVAQLQGTLLGDKAQLDYAGVELGYATLRSPIDGVAGIRQVDPGNIVHASDVTGLVVISQVHPIAVLFTVPEDDLARIRSALKAGPLRVTALDRTGETPLADGTVSVIDNQIDQATAMIRLKAIFPNADDALWPGQFVAARILLETRQQQIAAPTAAIRQGPEGRLAFVVAADGHVALRHVSTGATSNGLTIVTSGLSPGETVVTEGQYKLEDGAKVDAGRDGMEVDAGRRTSAPSP